MDWNSYLQGKMRGREGENFELVLGCAGTTTTACAVEGTSSVHSQQQVLNTCLHKPQVKTGDILGITIGRSSKKNELLCRAEIKTHSAVQYKKQELPQ